MVGVRCEQTPSLSQVSKIEFNLLFISAYNNIEPIEPNISNIPT